MHQNNCRGVDLVEDAPYQALKNPDTAVVCHTVLHAIVQNVLCRGAARPNKGGARHRGRGRGHGGRQSCSTGQIKPRSLAIMFGTMWLCNSACAAPAAACICRSCHSCLFSTNLWQCAPSAHLYKHQVGQGVQVVLKAQRHKCRRRGWHAAIVELEPRR